jgi:hypothetical protein
LLILNDEFQPFIENPFDIGKKLRFVGGGF